MSATAWASAVWWGRLAASLLKTRKTRGLHLEPADHERDILRREDL
jgi:hypothetical protein